MTDQLPAPLVSAEVDLRDFAFMPLDVQRLRDSDLASDETPEACWAAVLLWCASWHQVPAASIPDSDEWQAKHAGYKAQGKISPGWRKVKTGALRGWVACSDGRLYHPVIAEKAADAWTSKLMQRWRTECSRIKKHNQRHYPADGHLAAIPLPDFDDWRAAGCPQGQPLPVPEDRRAVSPGHVPSVPRETHSKGQGEGQGQGQGLEKQEPSASSAGPTDGLADDIGDDKVRPTVPCPYAAIVEVYHQALPTLPRVRLQDGPLWAERQRAMRSLWGWVLSSRKSDGTPRAVTAADGLAWIASYFGRASQNDFVMGRIPRGAGHENWRADFDYLLSKKGLKQVIEKTQDAA